MEIGAIASQSTFFFRNNKSDIEVPVAIWTGMTLIPHLDAHPSFNTRWDIDCFLYLFFQESFSITMLTFLEYLFSFSVTDMACTSLLHDTEDGLDTFPDLPASPACITSLCCSSLSRTVMAKILFRELYLPRRSAKRILETYLEFDLDIFSNLLSPCSSSTARESTAKER